MNEDVEKYGDKDLQTAFVGHYSHNQKEHWTNLELPKYINNHFLLINERNENATFRICSST